MTRSSKPRLTASVNPENKLLIFGAVEDTEESKNELKSFSLTGEELWSVGITNPQMVQPPVCGTDDRVYLTEGMRLRCLINGKMNWERMLKTDSETWLTISSGNSVIAINGSVMTLFDADGEKHRLNPGQLVYIHDNELHGFKNNGKDSFDLLCIVPARGEK